MIKLKRDSNEDVTQYYNEGPYGPNGEPKQLYKFFMTRWSPSGGGGTGSKFDDECKEALLEIRDKISDLKPEDKYAMRFIGTSNTDPIETPKEDLVVDGKPYTNPRQNDVIRFNTKEFVYRDDVGWKELGDEDAPSWNEFSN